MSLFKTDIINKGKLDENNSSTENLNGENSYTFTGIGTNTLGYNGLKWSLDTDQNATIYIDQSPDNINWDITYSYFYNTLAGGQGETIQITQSYYRVRVILQRQTTTTHFRLNSILCPFSVPLPSSLSPEQRLKADNIIKGIDDHERHVWVSPRNTMQTGNFIRLVGKGFDGMLKDPNFWTETIDNGGTVSQAGGYVILKTGTNPNGSAKYTSNKRGRFVAGTVNIWLSRTGVSTLVDNNIIRAGCYDEDNGFFFQIDSNILAVGYRKNGVDTIIEDGNFNGVYGPFFAPDPDRFFSNSIEWTPIAIYFYINERLVHTLSGDIWSETSTLPITVENFNYNGATNDIEFYVVETAIMREGNLITDNTYYHISGLAGTHTLKYGAGKLQRISINNTSGTSLTIYDGVDDVTGDVIGIITTGLSSLGTWDFDLSFDTGLTIVTVGNSLDATVIYE